MSVHMVERFRVSDHSPAVCVRGPWVTCIFSMTSYTHHSCMSMYIVQMEQIGFCGNVFPLSAPFSIFFKLLLVLVQPMVLVYLPEYHYQS